MSKLKQAYAEVLDTLLEKHLQGKLTWAPRDGEDSFETSVGNFNFHIDRKPINGPNYRVWIFDRNGDAVDSFDTKDLTEVHPVNPLYDSYLKVASVIYRDVNEAITLALIGPALDNLKAI